MVRDPQLQCLAATGLLREFTLHLWKPFWSNWLRQKREEWKKSAVYGVDQKVCLRVSIRCNGKPEWIFWPTLYVEFPEFPLHGGPGLGWSQEEGVWTWRAPRKHSPFALWGWSRAGRCEVAQAHVGSGTAPPLWAGCGPLWGAEPRLVPQVAVSWRSQVVRALPGCPS